MNIKGAVDASVSVDPRVVVSCFGPTEIGLRLPEWERWYDESHYAAALTHHPGWLRVFQKSLGHSPYCLEACRDGKCVGLLPVVLVDSVLFGRRLVGLPYLNSGGVMANDPHVIAGLICCASDLADRLKVRQLQLRHEVRIEHPCLTETLESKVHMRLALPRSLGTLWDGLDAKVRNQVRKAERNGITIEWGRQELLSAFYGVFSHNMRDLGTPVYGLSLFAKILEEFPDETQICIARLGRLPVASAILTHGKSLTEVPSASSLRAHNRTNANMLMYWHLLKNSVDRGQQMFDFGRCTLESSTHSFKRQWGARPEPAIWQYSVRTGTVSECRPDNEKFRRAVQIWQRLPLWLANRIGPWIVRGIP